MGAKSSLINTDTLGSRLGNPSRTLDKIETRLLRVLYDMFFALNLNLVFGNVQQRFSQ